MPPVVLQFPLLKDSNLLKLLPWWSPTIFRTWTPWRLTWLILLRLWQLHQLVLELDVHVYVRKGWYTFAPTELRVIQKDALMSWGVVLNRDSLLRRCHKTSIYFARLVELYCLPGILCVLGGRNVHPRGFDIPLFCYLVLAEPDWQIDLSLNLWLLDCRCDNQVLTHAICSAPGIRAVAWASIGGRCSCWREKLSFGSTLSFVLGWIKFWFQIDRLFLVFVYLSNYLLLGTLSRNFIFKFFSAIRWACGSHRT